MLDAVARGDARCAAAALSHVNQSDGTGMKSLLLLLCCLSGAGLASASNSASDPASDTASDPASGSTSAPASTSASAPAAPGPGAQADAALPFCSLTPDGSRLAVEPCRKAPQKMPRRSVMQVIARMPQQKNGASYGPPAPATIAVRRPTAPPAPGPLSCGPAGCRKMKAKE